MSKVLIKKSWNKREVALVIEEEFQKIIDGESNTWEEEDREIEYYNLEKGYEDMQLIARRIHDNKYFMFDYTNSDGEGIITKFPIEGKEVFPKTIETIIYE